MSLDLSSPDAEDASRKTIARIVGAFHSSSLDAALSRRATSVDLSSASSTSISSPRRGGNVVGMAFSSAVGTARALFTKVRILHKRAWRQVTRDKPLNIARFMSSLFSSLLFGAIYFKMGKVVPPPPTLFIV